MAYTTEQEKFWAGSFGDEYVDRNSSADFVSSNTYLFSKILSRTINVDSVIEFGANIGLNLMAIRNLMPDVTLSAIEINEKAVASLKEIQGVSVYPESILADSSPPPADFVLIKGVLIHINPDCLEKVYEKLYQTALKYICIVEYYNPTPVEISYRGHRDRLFKRDFAGEVLDQYTDLKLVDYGFIYHRDNNFPADDCTWFLLEKPSMGS
jgi:pseudaminic acid biosynthesis-associated methylase